MCVLEDLTFRASGIHLNDTGAYRVMSGSQQRRVYLIFGNGSRFAWKTQSSLQSLLAMPTRATKPTRSTTSQSCSDTTFFCLANVIDR